MQAVAVPSLALLQEMHPSSQQEHSVPLLAEPGSHPLLRAVPAGMLATVLAVANRVRLLHQVLLMEVCPADLVQKVLARSRSSRQSIRLICRP